MSIIAAGGLLLFAVILYALVALKTIKSNTLVAVANICQIGSLLGTAMVFVVPGPAGPGTSDVGLPRADGARSEEPPPRVGLYKSLSTSVTIDENTTFHAFEGQVSVSLVRSYVRFLTADNYADITVGAVGYPDAVFRGMELGASRRYSALDTYDIRLTKFIRQGPTNSVEISISVVPKEASMTGAPAADRGISFVAEIAIALLLAIGIAWIMHVKLSSRARQTFLAWTLAVTTAGLVGVALEPSTAGSAFVVFSLAFEALTLLYLFGVFY